MAAVWTCMIMFSDLASTNTCGTMCLNLMAVLRKEPHKNWELSQEVVAENLKLHPRWLPIIEVVKETKKGKVNLVVLSKAQRFWFKMKLLKIYSNTPTTAIFKEVSKQKIHNSILKFKEFEGHMNKESC